MPVDDLTPEQIAAIEAEKSKAAEELKAAEEAAATEEKPPEGQTPEQLREWALSEQKKRQEANKAVTTLKAQLAKHEKAEEDRKKASMTEVERAKAEADAAKAEAATARQEAQDARIQIAAAKAGFSDPKDALAFIDRVKLGEDETKLDDMLKGILAAKPYLKGGTGLPTGTPGNPASGLDKAAAETKVRQAYDGNPVIRKLFKRAGLGRPA